MEIVRFRVTGISPLLMHNPQGMKTEAEGPKVKRIPTPEDEAERGAYRLPDGQLFVGTAALRSSMIDGGIGKTFGPRKHATKIAGSSVFILEECCPLYHPDSRDPLHEYVIDRRRAVVQGNGVLRARPRIDAWTTEIEFEYDPDFIRAEWIEDLFSTAGRIVGIGDYRPRCPKGKGGPFGRYRVERIDAA